MTAHNTEFDKEQLLRLSNEVGRIASTLAKLSTDPDPSASDATSHADDPVPEIAPETVASIIRARRLRAAYFDGELFADPAWDMLLELFHAELTYRSVPVSLLCDASTIPATTGLRWLKTMVDKGLFLRRKDPLDGRRVYVELRPETSKAMKRYFGRLPSTSVI